MRENALFESHSAPLLHLTIIHSERNQPTSLGRGEGPQRGYTGMKTGAMVVGVRKSRGDDCSHVLEPGNT